MKISQNALKRILENNRRININIQVRERHEQAGSTRTCTPYANCAIFPLESYLLNVNNVATLSDLIRLKLNEKEFLLLYKLHIRSRLSCFSRNFLVGFSRAVAIIIAITKLRECPVLSFSALSFHFIKHHIAVIL